MAPLLALSVLLFQALPPELAARLDAPGLTEKKFGDLCVEAVRLSYPNARIQRLNDLNVKLENPDIDLQSFENAWRSVRGHRAEAVWDSVANISAVLKAFQEPGLASQIILL